MRKIVEYKVGDSLETWIKRHKNSLGFSSEANVTDQWIEFARALQKELSAIEAMVKYEPPQKEG